MEVRWWWRWWRWLWWQWQPVTCSTDTRLPRSQPLYKQKFERAAHLGSEAERGGERRRRALRRVRRRRWRVLLRVRDLSDAAGEASEEVREGAASFRGARLRRAVDARGQRC